MPALTTTRLELWPITLPFVEAVMAGDRAAAEAVCGAPLPTAWPGPDLIARAFAPSIEEVRADPDTRLWGDTLLIARTGRRRVVGSVVFHGRPRDGVAEVGYGVDDDEQRQGFATEGARACVEWALAEPGVTAVTATTFPWHTASLRVIAHLGMRPCGQREHPFLGELLVFERRGPSGG
ncbi:MAG: GNAT family N-acetyltransferase [Myxococcales bacterium]|nr:GNAT family N-acetyltransferase [Myxococcales bacterium]